jgi:hypothetical protein
MDPWLTRCRDVLARESGIPPEELELEAETAKTLLDLARIAAHESGNRVNAPLLCYLVGVASRNADVQALADALRRDAPTQ